MTVSGIYTPAEAAPFTVEGLAHLIGAAEVVNFRRKA